MMDQTNVAYSFQLTLRCWMGWVGTYTTERMMMMVHLSQLLILNEFEVVSD